MASIFGNSQAPSMGQSTVPAGNLAPGMGIVPGGAPGQMPPTGAPAAISPNVGMPGAIPGNPPGITPGRTPMPFTGRAPGQLPGSMPGQALDRGLLPDEVPAAEVKVRVFARPTRDDALSQAQKGLFGRAKEKVKGF